MPSVSLSVVAIVLLLITNILLIAMLVSMRRKNLHLWLTTKSLIDLFKPHRYGVYKRIQEIREIRKTIEKVDDEPWAVGWCDSQEHWMITLATELESLGGSKLKLNKEYDYDAENIYIIGRKKYGL